MNDNSKFRVILPGKRIWAIASIHSDYERLKALHAAIAQKYKAGDVVIYLGNIIGQGKEVIKTLNEVLYFRRALIASLGACVEDVVFLKGSSEEMFRKMLQIQYANNARKVMEYMFLHGLGTVVEAYGSSVEEALSHSNLGSVSLCKWVEKLRKNMQKYDGHQKFLNSLFYASYTEDKKLLFVHKGIDPDLPLLQQKDNFWWGSSKPFERLGAAYEGFGKVIRGASENADYDKPFFSRHFITLDLGCGYGGKLCACLFDETFSPAELITV